MIGRRGGRLVASGVVVFAVTLGALVTPSAAAPTRSSSAARSDTDSGWQRHSYRKAGFDRAHVAIAGLATSEHGFVAITSATTPRDRARAWTSRDGLRWTQVRRDASPRARDTQAIGPIAGSSRAVVTFVQEWRESPLAAREPTRRTRSVWWSRDSREWERISGSAFTRSFVYDIDAGPTGFVAVGIRADKGVERPAAWHSVDGRSWERATVPDTDVGPSRVAHLPSAYVAAGSHDDRPVVWTSTEGRAWRKVEANLMNTVVNLSSLPRSVVAITEPLGVSEPGDSLWMTADGRGWELLPAFHEQHPTSVADEVVDLRGTWVVAGSNGLGPESGAFAFSAWTRSAKRWTEMPASLTTPLASAGPRMVEHQGRVVVMTGGSRAFWTWTPR